MHKSIAPTTCSNSITYTFQAYAKVQEETHKVFFSKSFILRFQL